ncbi:MAG: hypothetical protein ACKVOK_03060 [Flavobacteriales bacterium]
MKITPFLFLVVILYNCQGRVKESSPIQSPSGKYSIIACVNQPSTSEENFAIVLIKLYSREGIKLSELNTQASDFSKWAVGWDTFNDTLILNSRDIGVLAWKIEQNEFKEVFASEAIQNRAAEIFTTEQD